MTRAAAEPSRTRLPGFATITAHDYLVLPVFADLDGALGLPGGFDDDAGTDLDDQTHSGSNVHPPTESSLPTAAAHSAANQETRRPAARQGSDRPLAQDAHSTRLIRTAPTSL
jgi:hypothetical protein